MKFNDIFNCTFYIMYAVQKMSFREKCIQSFESRIFSIYVRVTFKIRQISLSKHDGVFSKIYRKESIPSKIHKKFSNFEEAVNNALRKKI